MEIELIYSNEIFINIDYKSKKITVNCNNELDNVKLLLEDVRQLINKYNCTVIKNASDLQDIIVQQFTPSNQCVTIPQPTATNLLSNVCKVIQSVKLVNSMPELDKKDIPSAIYAIGSMRLNKKELNAIGGMLHTC